MRCRATIAGNAWSSERRRRKMRAVEAQDEEEGNYLIYIRCHILHVGFICIFSFREGNRRLRIWDSRKNNKCSRNLTVFLAYKLVFNMLTTSSIPDPLFTRYPTSRSRALGSRPNRTGRWVITSATASSDKFTSLIKNSKNGCKRSETE